MTVSLLLMFVNFLVVRTVMRRGVIQGRHGANRGDRPFRPFRRISSESQDSQESQERRTS